MTTTGELLDAIRAHLDAFDVAEPWSVYLTTYSAGPSVDMQLSLREPSQIAQELLAWADTLTEVTAEAWRPAGGDMVHLAVIGQLSEGIVVRVFGLVPLTSRGLGGNLAAGDNTVVPLVLLRQWASSGE